MKEQMNSVLEILNKAGLSELGKHLTTMELCNLEGTSPCTILGIAIGALRSLNSMAGVALIKSKV